MNTPVYHHTFHPWETNHHQQEPLKWNHDWQELNQTLKVTDNPRILCSDWLADVPIEWLTNLLKLIHQTPHLRWLLLSRHPKNWAKQIDEVCKLWACDGSYHETVEARAYHELLCPWRAGKPPHNVWIGTIVENQEQADKRIPDSLKIPAQVRFIYCEPLRGPVNLINSVGCSCRTHGCNFDAKWNNLYHLKEFIHWVICGGGIPPMHPGWARSLRDQCETANVPFFFTDWGNWEPVHTSNVDEAKDIRFLELNGTDSTDWPLDQHSQTTAMMGRLSTKNNTLLDGHKHHARPSE